jgi:hypothetical protein
MIGFENFSFRSWSDLAKVKHLYIFMEWRCPTRKRSADYSKNVDTFFSCLISDEIRHFATHLPVRELCGRAVAQRGSDEAAKRLRAEREKWSPLWIISENRLHGWDARSENIFGFFITYIYLGKKEHFFHVLIIPKCLCSTLNNKIISESHGRNPLYIKHWKIERIS